MRILRVAQKVYPEVPGGGTYHVHAMCRDQAAMGHDVTLLTIRHDESLPHVEERVRGTRWCATIPRFPRWATTSVPGWRGISSRRKISTWCMATRTCTSRRIWPRSGVDWGTCRWR